MSVIAELRIPSADFELGRILTVEGMSSIELESLIPLGEATVPLFWVYNSTRDPFVETVQRHPAVNSASEIDVFEDRTLFTLDWDANQDHLFRGISENDGQLLSAVGTPDAWDFELRFPSNDALSEFTTHCEDAQVPVEATRVYNPTNPDAGPWYGLTESQREAMRLAVEEGYYDIPRRCTTQELANELGISDQAVTERLRRAIVTLVTYTLVPSTPPPRVRRLKRPFPLYTMAKTHAGWVPRAKYARQVAHIITWVRSNSIIIKLPDKRIVTRFPGQRGRIG